MVKEAQPVRIHSSFKKMFEIWEREREREREVVARLFEIRLVVITVLRISIRNLRNYGDMEGLRSVFSVPRQKQKPNEE